MRPPNSETKLGGCQPLPRRLLAGIGVVAVEDEARGKRPTELPQLVERVLPTPVSLNLERPHIGDSDLDLIAFGRLVSDEAGLNLPHPRAADRRFVMGPLAEVLPDWRHPVRGERAGELAAVARVGRDASPS